MKFNITSMPCSFSDRIKLAVIGFFNDCVNVIKRGVSLGVMLFLALMTLSALNQVTEYLKDSGKTRVTQIQTQVNTNGVSQVLVKPWSQRPIVSASYGKQDNLSVSRNARDTLRESRYVVSELEQFTRTLAGLGK